MIDFLESGKGLYIEGVDFGMENGSSELYSYFGCNFVSNGNTSFYGNVRSLAGQTSTIAEGLTYDYLFQEGPDHYVDAISSNGGTIFLTDQNDTGRAVSYSGPTNSYRAIHSTIIFGALQENANTRNELMARYMTYLTGSTSLEDEPIEQIHHSNKISIHPNPFVSETKILFSTPKQNSLILQIYDIKGSLVFSHKQPVTSNSFVWKGKDNFGKEVNPGTYFIQFNNGSVSTTKAIVKTR